MLFQSSARRSQPHATKLCNQPINVSPNPRPSRRRAHFIAPAARLDSVRNRFSDCENLRNAAPDKDFARRFREVLRSIAVPVNPSLRAWSDWGLLLFGRKRFFETAVDLGQFPEDRE